MTSLSPIGVPDGLMWKCEVCSGMAANVSVLRNYLKGDTVKKLWLKAITASTPSNRKCPCCVNMMNEFTVSRDNRQIHLDLCRTCQLMWFDKNELEAFPRAKKLAGPNMDENLALAKIRLDAELENEQSSSENIIGLVIDILFMIIRFFL
jgi:Zn-finger nucleic acid-binding protein